MYFLPLSSGLKARSNVISYVTVNDSPDSDSSLSSPYSTENLSALRGNSGPLVEGPGRGVGDGAGTRTIIVPPLKTQLGDCTVATQASGECLQLELSSPLMRVSFTFCYRLLVPMVETVHRFPYRLLHSETSSLCGEINFGRQFLFLCLFCLD